MRSVLRIRCERVKSALIAAALAAAIAMPATACELAGARLQREALAILRSERPAASFRPGESVDVILMDDAAAGLTGVQLGLTNLQSSICIDESMNEEASLKLIREHFRAGLASLDALHDELAWEDAVGRLSVQLMPAEYAERMPLVTRQFADGIAVGIVVDGETTYRYVNHDDAISWKVDDAALFNRALANLAVRSKGMAFEAEPGTAPVIFVQTGDGFDAARILLPSLREDVARQLGEPFYAGIPNRDFLVMWSSRAGEEFRLRVAQLIASDCQQQSHPLSCKVLRVWRDGRVEAQAD